MIFIYYHTFFVLFSRYLCGDILHLIDICYRGEELVENAKYLGMSINSDISWDFHVQRLCQNMYYHLSLLRRLRPIFPKDLLLQVYKSYIQPRLDYGITLYACSTQKNIDLVQRVQNHAARLITGNFDYINCRGIDLIKSLNLYTIRERRDYFLTILMLKAIHGIAPTYLSDRIVMNFDVNGYDTRGSDMDLYLPTLHKESYRNSFMYMGGKLWNELPEFVQNSRNIESFKRNYRMYKLVINSWPNRYTYIFCNLSVSAWQWCNDYFPTLNKFRSVHGYWLLYFTRHRV